MERAEATPLEAYAEPELRRQRGLWSDAFRRLRRNRLAVAGLVVLAALVILTILGNYVDAVQRYEPSAQPRYDDPNYLAEIHSGPSSKHFFGTDSLGRDNWARVLEGTAISLQVGLGVQAAVLIIGIIIGGSAALGGRIMDNIMMRFTDIGYAFPDLLAIILLRSVFADRDLPLVGEAASQRLLVIFAIAFVGWVTVARLIRGQMLSLKERDFVIAARASGASELRIVIQHMLPNTLGPVIVAVVFGIPLAIFAEAVLAFIGIGLQPPTASLGTLVQEGYSFIEVNRWIVVFPAATIALLMLCFTFLGDGLRDALDPRER